LTKSSDCGILFVSNYDPKTVGTESLMVFTACRGYKTENTICMVFFMLLCACSGAFSFEIMEVKKLPSTKILEQKQQIVKELVDKIKAAKSGVLVDFKGITVINDTQLRSDLRKAGVEYSVVKNTLTSKACDIIGYEQLKSVLNGMTAMAISNSDELAPAKILSAYAKKNENFVIKAGFVDGGVIDAAGVEELAEIPSKEILIARVMGSLQSSLYGFAFALQAIIDKNDAGETTEAIEA